MAETAPLNQLLEEAANRAAALAEQADEAAGRVDELLDKAESLGETLTDESADAHRGFQDLQARLDAAADALEERAQRARTSLDALPARTTSAQGRVAALLAAVKGQLAALKAKEDELSATLDGRSEAAEADLHRLAEQGRQLQAAAEVQMDEATRELETLHAAVAQAREDIRKGRGELLAAMDALEDSAREQVQRFVEGMGTALTAHTKALFDLEHQLKDAHNDAVVALRKTLAEEVVSRLPAAAGSLKESLESLAGFCGEGDQALADECSQVLEAYERAIQSAQRSQGILQSVDRLA